MTVSSGCFHRLIFGFGQARVEVFIDKFDKTRVRQSPSWPSVIAGILFTKI